MKTSFRLMAVTIVAVGSWLANAPPAMAQAGTAAQANKDRAGCDGVQQDRAACLREAGAAQQAALHDGLTSEPESYRKNASARCQLQPPADRADCEARVRGTGMSTREGSVMGGGTIQETVTPIPARTK
jgi:hypothetical protein